MKAVAVVLHLWIMVTQHLHTSTRLIWWNWTIKPVIKT